MVMIGGNAFASIVWRGINTPLVAWVFIEAVSLSGVACTMLLSTTGHPVSQASAG